MQTRKMKLFTYLYTGLLALNMASCMQEKADELDLSGEWKLQLTSPEVTQVPEAGFDQVVNLPGSLQEQGYGEDIGLQTEWTGQIVDRSWYDAPEYEPYRQPGNIKVPFWLNPEKHYVGVAWYQKQVTIPAGWEARPVVLELERAHWTTTLYVDGKPMGEQVSLQTPHRYVLQGLAPGQHTFTLKVDNRLYVNVGANAHSVSDHTQSNWNGIIGDLTLSPKPVVYIEDVQVYPDIHAKKIEVKVALKGTVPQEPVKLSLMAKSADGKSIGQPVSYTYDAGTTDPSISLSYHLGDSAELWSEHNPAVYRLTTKLQVGSESDQKETDFGLREFKANGTRFEVNGHPIFLRGTLECCIFPLTGYPSMERSYWAKIYRTCKEYGLNHVRFHSWCPPEVAFQVADSLGIYLQVECGAWTDVGSGQPQDQWIKEESARILKEYGNHPSFCLLAHGNEPSGANQASYLADLVDYWKAEDNHRRVYTSAAGWPYIPNGDYWSTMDPRIQVWGAGLNSVINKESPRTDYDFSHIIRKDMPTVSHEVGQWCVYPNFQEISKYTGVLKAKNLEIFQASLQARGMASLADKFLYASGRLQTLCYKADIEAALRTPGFAGFQLLDLHDFPGQGTALVGVLDPFWDSKGYVDGEEYRMFCNETVPLARFPKMVWLNDEKLEVPIEVAHFGTEPLENVRFCWDIAKPNEEAYHFKGKRTTIPIGNGHVVDTITYDLSDIQEPTQLIISSYIKDTEVRNQWNIWVYPAKKKAIAQLPYITSTLDARAQAELEKGGSVLLLNYGKVPEEKGGDIAVGFSSIFWNTAWTNKQPPHTLGIYCEKGHPALHAFPNEGVSDYQWWDLMSRCDAMVLDDFPKDFKPIVYIIDDWFTNRKLGLLYEAKVSKGKLLVCSADLQHDLSTRPAASQFRQSLLEYMASDAFNPAQELNFADIF